MKVSPQTFFNFCAMHVPLLRALQERVGELSEADARWLIRDSGKADDELPETTWRRLRELQILVPTEPGSDFYFLAEPVADRRQDRDRYTADKGRLDFQIAELAKQANEFSDFVEELERASLKNVEMEVRRLERQLGDAERETRAKAEQKVELYADLVNQKRQTIAHFDRALVTVLRRDLTDDQLAPLARLFNFDLLHQPVGNDGIRLHKRDEFLRLLRVLSQRVRDSVYRDANVELPLPASQHGLADLANLDALRERLTEEEETLKRSEGILEAITAKETLTKHLHQQRANEKKMRNRFFGWEQFQKAKAEAPRLKADLQQTKDALTAAAERIDKLEKQLSTARNDETKARNGIRDEENAFNAVMERFNQCVFPEFPGKPESP